MNNSEQTKPTKKPEATTPNTETSQKDEKYTKQFVFYSVLASVLIVIAGGILIYWLVGRYINQSNKNKAQDKTIKLLEEKKANLSALEPNYSKIIEKGPGGKSDADLILNALPVDDGYKQIITMVEKMAQESGVKVSSTTKTNSTQSSNVAVAAQAESYSISVSLSGEFTNVREFLKKTEKSSRVMNFSAMDISGSTKSGTVDANITFEVYFKGPADIAPTQKELE